MNTLTYAILAWDYSTLKANIMWPRDCESWVWLYYQQLDPEQIAEVGTIFFLNTEEGVFGLIHKSAGFSGILYYFTTNFIHSR